MRKSHYISKNARDLLVLIKGKLSSRDIVFLNHEYISTITYCGSRQNLRIVNELKKALKNELEIKYHVSALIDGRKQRGYHSFVYKR